jgi:dTDP-4-amino-4,6-dideoxygalactose transaminase
MNIPLFKVFMSDKVSDPLLKVLYSGWIGQGNIVKNFEKLLGDRFKNDKVLTVSAGTHALTLALMLLNIGKGDSVITTPLTCTATNFPIILQGADIIWGDIKKDFNIDPYSIESLIKDSTKAIFVVHWGGYSVDMKEIYTIAKKYNLAIVEDGAHAYGALYQDSLVGECKYSNFTMMSFQAIKTLSSGDGGALFCKELTDYKNGKLLRWYGIDREGPREDFRCEAPISRVGGKYHMNDINAIIGLTNMEEAEENLRITRENADYYDKELSNINGIELTQISKDRKSSYWLYTFLVDKRSDFCFMMSKKGIAVSRVHERNDLHPCTKQFKRDLPMLEYVVNKMISIPVGWWVTKEQREYIVDCIKAGW